MGEEPKLLCYNRGCGQEFKESENSFNSCRFHPGNPFFHDAYKGWTCCRKSVDFQEFLNMKGCSTGYHTNVKPPEPEKKKEVVEMAEEVICQPKYEMMKRPSKDEPLVLLKTTLSESLKKQTYENNSNGGHRCLEQEVKPGLTQCVNNGCKTRYEGSQTDGEVCKFHPGVPIFHEGLKFWSCCKKRTTDFDVFMSQEGCATGKHLWIKPIDVNDVGGINIKKCRNDWHQDGSFVNVVIYGGGKKFDPDKSHVKVNGVTLKVELFFPEEPSVYKETWILAGIISPEQSSVFMTPMKVEIKLKKAEPVHWKDLNILQEAIQNSLSLKNAEEEHKNVGVDPVDLSDL